MNNIYYNWFWMAYLVGGLVWYTIRTVQAYSDWYAVAAVVYAVCVVIQGYTLRNIYRCRRLQTRLDELTTKGE
jgi:low affinity Fe/Cu permease